LRRSVAPRATPPTATAPRAGEPEDRRPVPEYLNKQLGDFKPKDGKKPARESPVMMGMVANLSEADMKSLAAYYAAQQLKPSAAADKDLVALGQKIWRGGNPAKNIPACSGCHGPADSGIPAQYPGLAGQYAEYLGSQLKAFREATRANDTKRHHARRGRAHERPRDTGGLRIRRGTALIAGITRAGVVFMGRVIFRGERR